MRQIGSVHWIFFGGGGGRKPVLCVGGLEIWDTFMKWIGEAELVASYNMYSYILFFPFFSSLIIARETVAATPRR